ncbi:hypothetical protein ASPZODRAFT_20739 [Penicilliopsis zonata CBS 506.65]|uniref:chitinase n=1 Tax=Penicilliopsis zonata CBS 506.65 TaxID=1073090 RepID=A0A1L9S4Q5_9EURO|nr:hypothetical protein ASPZODRAFT_20739 [Penicilliopsis zonata CBS 506.65]OJJ42141.1 hypothetical protein ASPZODRAFT_20739 [Penicilliopsis zonata CBS 506.65]
MPRAGYCGFGPSFCGSGCVSNCDATSECGPFANPPGKTCPLNTCCSQYGFCGTTEEFCGAGCQSNCVLHPQPPPGSPNNQTLSKVIGYYEAWSARSKCHQTSPKDLPVNGLTHLNYAFAYIDPSTWTLTTMDGATPLSLFDDLAALKATNPNLNIFISVGGWSFSDNDTATQPIFGNLAREETNRRTFAKNALAFLNQYGFDGIDIDWEYPGAPDRGGSKDDTQNYVHLLEALRTTFTNSGRKLGVTFTAPSSYWYLRWFDLPGMLKYADWMNWMTYDLHGVWDSSNPMHVPCNPSGSIVQGHTNLTEIKTAAELLWRVRVNPAQVSLGFAFYGRAFSLQDPGCTSPGCPFSGGADPGVCTGTSGYLSYYEIEQILSSNPDINIVHDNEAAVKYFAWSAGHIKANTKNRKMAPSQWISYDDKDTFGQKKEWTDEIGIGGSLIWASDLDDYDWKAQSGLTGIKVMEMGPGPVQTKEVLDGSLAKKCYLGAESVYRMPDGSSNPGILATTCRPDTAVGYDSHGCANGDDSSCVQPICCPPQAGLKNCQWRGDSSDGICNGECNVGEVKVASSSWGELDMQKCKRGEKVLCCEAGYMVSLIDGCRWTSNGDQCSSTEDSVAIALDLSGRLANPEHAQNYYCCSNEIQPTPLYNCHWVGEGDCDDVNCAANEVTLWRDALGDKPSACPWSKEKALCCQPHAEALAYLLCDIDLCKDIPEWCGDEDGIWDDEEGNEDYLHIDVLKGRPGEPREMIIQIGKLLGSSMEQALKMTSRGYAPGFKTFQGDGWRTMARLGGYKMGKDVCSATIVSFVKKEDILETGWNAEHLQEIQMVGQLIKTAVTGTLPSGKTMQSSILDAVKLINGWNKVYDTTLPRIGALVTDVAGWTPPVTPNDRIFEVIGSFAYRTGISFVERDINSAKLNLVKGYNVMALRRFKGFLDAVNLGNETAAKVIATTLQKTIGVFEYLNAEASLGGLTEARTAFLMEIARADKYMPELKGLLSIWKEFEPDFYATMVRFAASWINARIQQVHDRFPAGGSIDNPAVLKLLYDVKLISIATNRIKFDSQLDYDNVNV